MLQSEPIGEANFVKVGNKKWPALYCSSCLAIEVRRNEPKSLINPDTLEEYYYIEELPDKDDNSDVISANRPSSEEAQTTSTKETEATSV